MTTTQFPTPSVSPSKPKPVSVAPGAFGGPALNGANLTRRERTLVCRLSNRLSGRSTPSLVQRFAKILGRRLHRTAEDMTTALNDQTLCR